MRAEGWALPVGPAVRPPRRLASGSRRHQAEPGNHASRDRRRLQLSLLTIVIVLGTQLPAPAQTEEEGRALYEENCQSCHQPGGTGVEGAFPPLADNPNVDDTAHVEDVVRNGLSGPIEVNGVAFDGVMPAFPQLSDTQIAALTAYVQALGAPPTDGSTTTTTAPPGPVAGDAANGESLFDGTTPLAAGGTACVACHVAGPVTQGGSLGPDLTDVVDRLGGPAGLSAWLVSPATPNMQSQFAGSPLTEAEITALTAFFSENQGAAPQTGPDWLVLGGLTGLVVLLAVVAVLAPGKRLTYADRLRRRR